MIIILYILVIFGIYILLFFWFYSYPGTPEAPVLDDVRTYISPRHDDLATVQAYVKWTPGYDGGQRVWYKISYGIRAEGFKNSGEITEKCNCYTITEGLEADKDYLFFVLAHNNAGPSNNSNTMYVRTKGEHF